MNCHERSTNQMIIYSKSCSSLSDGDFKYNACIIWVKCNTCGSVEDFFINTDYYGYIDENFKPVKGDWKL